jgi:hypothetical protein
MSQIKNEIYKRINNKALGNSNRGMKEIASDLLNDLGRNELKNIEKGTFLSRSTLERLMELTEAESGAEYRPQSETLERVMRYCGAEIDVSFGHKIKTKFQNKPKPESETDD